MTNTESGSEHEVPEWVFWWDGAKLVAMLLYGLLVAVLLLAVAGWIGWEALQVTQWFLAETLEIHWPIWLVGVVVTVTTALFVAFVTLEELADRHKRRASNDGS